MKKGRRGKDMADIRKKAFETYLEHLGNISDLEIWQKYGINRQTRGSWPKTDKWEAILAETRQSTDKKIADKVSTSLVDGPDPGGKGGPLAVEILPDEARGDRRSQYL